MTIGAAVKVVLVASALHWIPSAWIQSTLPVDVNVVDKLKDLSSNAILTVAVVVLWRKLQEKDALLMVNYKSMTDALAANNATVTKMSETLDGIKEAVVHLVSVRNMLGERDIRTTEHFEQQQHAK